MNEIKDGIEKVADGAQILRVKPGDRVLLVFPRPITMAEADEVQALLRRQLPDVEFAIVNQVSHVVVQSPVSEVERGRAIYQALQTYLNATGRRTLDG